MNTLSKRNADSGTTFVLRKRTPTCLRLNAYYYIVTAICTRYCAFDVAERVGHYLTRNYYNVGISAITGSIWFWNNFFYPPLMTIVHKHYRGAQNDVCEEGRGFASTSPAL